MAIFLYEAVDQDGVAQKDKVEANDRGEAALILKNKGLIPFRLEAEDGAGFKINLQVNLFERMKPIDRITLVRNLGVTLKAGLNIIEAVQILIVDANKKIIRDILIDAKSSLERGQPLSVTFAKYSKYFSPVFAGLIQAGEASGHLDTALGQLSDQMDREFKLARKVKSALAYPMILLIASAVVVAVLLVFVLPRLARSFQMSGVELPLITKIIIGASNAVSQHIFIDLFVIAGFIFLISYIKRSKAGRRQVLSFMMKIPVVKELVKKVALVRFSRNLSTLIGSGINIIDALQLSAQTTGNDLYQEKIMSAIPEIRNGISLSETLRGQTKFFPHLFINMVAVGEKTGTLEYVLKTFSDFYEEEVDNTLKELTTYLEPLMLLVMGLVIGAIALSILLPIYQLIGKFS